MEGYENDYKKLSNVNSFMNLVFAGVNMTNAGRSNYEADLYGLQHFFDEMGLVETEIEEESNSANHLMNVYWKNIRIQLEKLGDEPIIVLNFYKNSHRGGK